MEQLASYVAPVATTIAALIVASNLGSRITGAGFIVFTIGSIAWALLGLATDQPNLLWQNVVLTVLNLLNAESAVLTGVRRSMAVAVAAQKRRTPQPVVHAEVILTQRR